jgi:hypothetical protein
MHKPVCLGAVSIPAVKFFLSWVCFDFETMIIVMYVY